MVNSTILRKRDLPVCVPLPGIKFDIDKLKEGYNALKYKMRNLWEENDGITGAHNQEFLKQLDLNQFFEVSLTTLDPSIDTTTVDQYKQDYKTKHNKRSHPAFDEGRWNYKTDDYKGSCFEQAIESQFIGEACRVRLHHLGAGKQIVPHIDYDPSYGCRVIVPVQGTDDVTNVFWKGKERQEYHLEANGSAYFINNGYRHAVYHNGSEDRIALVATFTTQEDFQSIALRKDCGPS
jgi:hypothetical protein